MKLGASGIGQKSRSERPLIPSLDLGAPGRETLSGRLRSSGKRHVGQNLFLVVLQPKRTATVAAVAERP